ncbi:MAG: ferrochelatase, partial [Burkholderiales bacterium]
MSSYRTEPPYQHGAPAQTGILLVNLGTPDAPTSRALRPYLKQFLSDPRVVEIPRFFWWPVLHGIILNTRPRKSAERYAKIWMSEGSPLKVHTERQANLLRGYLGERIKSPLSIEYA